MLKKFVFVLILIPVLMGCKKRFDCWCFYSSNTQGENYQRKDSQIFDKTDAAREECEGMSEVIYQEDPLDTITVSCQLIE